MEAMNAYGTDLGVLWYIRITRLIELYVLKNVQLFTCQSYLNKEV